MRTDNRARLEWLERILARCEEYRDRLEAMPSGKALVEQLRDAVIRTRDCFRGRPDRRHEPRKAARDWARAWPRLGAERRHQATMLRRLTKELRREMRMLYAASGMAITVPELPNSGRRRLIEDARSTLDAAAPFAEALRERGATCYDDLPAWLARVEAAVEAQTQARRPGRRAAEHEALRTGTAAAVALKPLFLAAVHGDYFRTLEWRRLRWTGAARARRPVVDQRSA